MTAENTVAEVLRHAVQGQGVVIDEVIVTPAGKRRVVKVIIDRDLGPVEEVTEPTQPLTLDEIAEATRTVSDVLDEQDLLGQQPYTLEVTSPGIGRDLTQALHYQRNVGRLVRLEPRDGEPVTGRILRASNSEVEVEVPAHKKVPATRHTLALEGITRGEVQVEFTRPAGSPDDAQKEN